VYPALRLDDEEQLPSLPYTELHDFLDRLRALGSEVGIKAVRKKNALYVIEFQILTATRPSEARNATWDEIDLINRMWKIPADRMKENEEHVVPLGPRACEILEAMKSQGRQESLVFGSMSAVTVNSIMERLGHGEGGERTRAVPHGFRSTFSTYTHERTNTKDMVIEACLAHVTGTPLERKYNRTKYWEEKKRCLEAWDRFIITRPTPADEADPNILQFPATRTA
jgi:integrase